MTTKILEIRDSMTLIAALAIQMTTADETQRYYLHRNGYTPHNPIIVVMKLSDQKATADPYEWPSLTGYTRTMAVAHEWIQAHFDELRDGDVVDVEFIMGSTVKPKVSERLEGF